MLEWQLVKEEIVIVSYVGYGFNMVIGIDGFDNGQRDSVELMN